MSRAARMVLSALAIAIVAAAPAGAARPATPQEHAAIATAIRRGVERRWHRSASGVHDVRVSTVGPWALARLNRPLFRVPNSLALLAVIGGRWTLVASSVTGGSACDAGESRAVDNDLRISRGFLQPDYVCSAPTTRTQSCGNDLAFGNGVTDIRATHLTCADAAFDESGWVANVQYRGCGPTRCRVLDRSSDILGLLCRLRRLHRPHARHYLARVTCTTPLQRLSFILHRRV